MLEDLAALIARLFHVDTAAQAQAAVRVLVESWFDGVYETPTSAEGRPTQSSFLLQYDLGYRLKRVAFLDDRIDHLLGASHEAIVATLGALAPVGSVAAPVDDVGSALRALKPKLNAVLVDLRRAGRTLRAGAAGSDGGPAISEATVAQVRTALGLTSATALTQAVFAGTRTPEQARARPASLLAREGAMAALSDLAQAVAAALSEPLIAASNRLTDALATPANATPGTDLALRLMRLYRDAYESYDGVILPFVHSGVGEAGRVRIMRISPASARTLVDESQRGPKLAGVQFGHFGGFFDERWRRNDMLWGRLDAAERLVEGLVPMSMPDRAAAVSAAAKEAQVAILEEERAGELLGLPERGAALWDRLHAQWKVDLALDQAGMRRVAEDEGNIWPTAFALKKLTADDEARIGTLVKRAVS